MGIRSFNRELMTKFLTLDPGYSNQVFVGLNNYNCEMEESVEDKKKAHRERRAGYFLQVKNH